MRDCVFKVILKLLRSIGIDSLIIEKAKTGPALREFDRFYPEMLGYLLRHVIRRSDVSGYDEVLVFVASLHEGKQKKALQKQSK